MVVDHRQLMLLRPARDLVGVALRAARRCRAGRGSAPAGTLVLALQLVVEHDALNAAAVR